MPYLNETGLSYYDPKLKEWISTQPVKTLPSTLYPWTQTDKAGAVTCWPVGGTPLLPTVDFLFTEVPPASGDKGPENPSTVMGASSVNVGRVGKNLLLKVASTQTVGTVAMTPQSDGSYIINGTTSGNINIAITDCGPEFGVPVYSSVRLNVNKNYTLTATILEGSISGTINVTFGYGGASGQYVAFYFTNGVASYTFNSSYFPDGHFIARIRAMAGASFSNAKIVFQLEEGDTTTAFEAPMLPADANHDIPLGNTYYGGEIDLATGLMTVTWDSFTFDGTEVWQSSENYLLQNTAGFYIDQAEQQAIGFDCYSGEINPVACEVFSTVNSFTIDSQSIYKSLGSFMIRVDNSRLSNYGYTFGTSTRAEAISAFKSWLSDNNVTVFYRRETPYTIQLSPTEILSLTQADKYTPRLNILYTDAQSIQVGYVKSPIREEYELTQAIVAQGGEI